MRYAFLLACLLSLVSATANASQSSGAGAGKITIQPQQPTLRSMLFPWYH